MVSRTTSKRGAGLGKTLTFGNILKLRDDDVDDDDDDDDDGGAQRCPTFDIPTSYKKLLAGMPIASQTFRPLGVMERGSSSSSPKKKNNQNRREILTCHFCCDAFFTQKSSQVWNDTKHFTIWTNMRTYTYLSQLPNLYTCIC